MQIKKIIKKYNFEKTDKENGGFYDICYDYKIFLKNININWYLKIENPNRMCKFYSLFSRFDTNSKNILEKINNIIECNTSSGKCNRYVYDIADTENFIKSVMQLKI